MVNLSEKELHAPTIVAENIEHESSILIAVPQPLGGVIVIGRETVTYCKSKFLKYFIIYFINAH